MVSIVDIIISGASVAGPSLAYWLHRHGFRPTVVERAPHLRGGGYAVDFRGDVHLGVLRRMGVLDAIRRRQTHMGDLSYVASDGTPRATMPNAIFSGDVEILRGDLAEVLYETTRADTEYLFGDEITRLDERPDGVEVTFAHAAPRRFDLVIGADGIHSGTRRLAFGDESRFITDLGMFVAIYPVPNLLGLHRTGQLHSIPGRTSSVFAAGDDSAIAMLCFRCDAPFTRDVAAQKELVRAEFRGTGWHNDAIVDAIDTADDFYFDTTSQVRMDTWSRGRIGLIGDAGYGAGPGGNGTGTAVVAAYVLAGELARADGDHQAAFQAYERLLRPYVHGGQKQAAQGREFLAPATWKTIHRRDRLFRMMRYLPVKGLIKRMATRTATAIDLPDYPIGPLARTP
jgi:2-polyprenyl-6-methoxyphenol hydroxylase-like FAD-dependent oxidoreductase